MRRLTIHRALAELKTLDDRINNALAGFDPIGLFQKGREVKSAGTGHARSIKNEDFKAKAEADWAKINDLVNNKTAIKKAIVESNSKTKVKIGEKEVTVADAITEKSYIVQKINLLNKLKNVIRKAQGDQNLLNEAVNKKKDEILLTHFGKDVKTTDPKDVDNIITPYLDNNLWSLADPLELQKRADALETEISTFASEVDACLSESNAITFIEIE